MQSSSNFQTRLQRWLLQWGFEEDPFSVYEADQERFYLHHLFVDRPYLHEILGDPAHPQTAFLLAKRGEGKTATREMVAYECTHAQFRRQALAIRYFDFDFLLEQVGGDPLKLSTRHHVNLIVREILKALAYEVPPTFYEHIIGTDRSVLMSYIAEFADPRSQLELTKILSCQVQPLRWEAFSPLETLQTLAHLITKLGSSNDKNYQSLYILVDRVDETPLGIDHAHLLLKPLVSTGPLLETPHVAFKFFLPTEVGEKLRQEVKLRTDRICFQQISWGKDDLRRIVDQRLAHFSNNKVERFEDLCSTTVKNSALDRLIKACENSPRTLLRMCRNTIYHHIDNSDTALLSLPDILDVLIEFNRQREAERPPIEMISRESIVDTVTVTQSTLSNHGIFLDDSGHVWINGQPLTPPLSNQEYQLLRTLYRNNTLIVSQDTLMEAVWPISDSDRATEQNLRKLINRVRERLEPGVEGKESRYIKNAKGRGYYLIKE